MAQSIRNIICQINDVLSPVFPGSKFYGVAQLLTTEGRVQPTSNDRLVSFDDAFSLQAYHRLNGVNIKETKGYGRENNITNTFSVSMIVFNNEKRTGLQSEEIAMIFQSLVNGLNITSASVSPASFILNTQAIFATEYRGHEFRLPEHMSLIQFNYTVDITFKSGCFDLCPEDFSQCKNN